MGARVGKRGGDASNEMTQVCLKSDADGLKSKVQSLASDFRLETSGFRLLGRCVSNEMAMVGRWLAWQDGLV